MRHMCFTSLCRIFLKSSEVDCKNTKLKLAEQNAAAVFYSNNEPGSSAAVNLELRWKFRERGETSSDVSEITTITNWRCCSLYELTPELSQSYFHVKYGTRDFYWSCSLRAAS